MTGLIKKAFKNLTDFFSGPDKAAQKALADMRQIWDKQTLLGLLNNQVVISEAVMNELIARQAAESDDFKDVSIRFIAGNRLAVSALAGSDRIGFEAAIESFQHGEWDTVVRFKLVRTVSADLHKLTQLVALVGAALFSRFFGIIDIENGVDTLVSEDCAGVYCNPSLFAAELQQMDIFGQMPTKMVAVTGATVGEKGLVIDSELTVPEQVSSVLKFLASKLEDSAKIEN